MRLKWEIPRPKVQEVLDHVNVKAMMILNTCAEPWWEGSSKSSRQLNIAHVACYR